MILIAPNTPGMPPGMGKVEKGVAWGAWVAQSVNLPASAQVMISWLVGSSPESRASGSVLMAQSPEPALDSMSPSLSLPLPHLCSASLCLSKNKR